MTPSFACEVWDNCGVSNSCKLERLQLEAARIITGLPIFTNTEYLPRYIEKLAGRDWKREELGESSNYSIISKTVAHPPYLLDHIPPTIQSRTIYPLRNGNDIIVPFCRLSLTRDFFVPATVREWNSLNLSVRNLDTLYLNLKRQSAVQSQCQFRDTIGPRKLIIILTQLRCNASFLNYDLCKANILSNASCSCGAPCENSHHFSFDCDKYTDNREILFNSLNWLPSNINIDCKSTDKRK